MAEPADIRDETCTNLSILLKLLIRNSKQGVPASFIATRKQLATIREILSEPEFTISGEPLPEDLLVTVLKK
jgi:hypothetical protein